MKFMGYTAYGTQDIVMGISAAVVSLALFLYPIPTFCRIVLHMTTGNLQPYPYKAMQTASIVWMIYAIPAEGETFTFHDFCLYGVNNVGLIFLLFYMFTFHYFTTERYFIMIYAIALGELLLLFGVPAVLGYWFGFISIMNNPKIIGPAFVIFGLVMYGSPLPAIIDAYKRRSTETLPFGFCTMFTLNAVAWFSYAFFYPPTRDGYVAIAHGGGIILGVGQLISCFVCNVKLQNSGAATEDSIPFLDGTP